MVFSWDFGTGVDRYFQFTVLPFGLSSAPFIFTKLLKPLEAPWRGQGIPIALFFDDGIGAGSSLNSAKINSSIVRADLARCGFEINKEKSSWEPERKFSWIGYDIDTQTGFIFASAVRMEKLLNDLNEVCSVLEASAFVHVKRIASIVGQIISMSPSCGNFTQIMTRYLNLVINTRHSWNSMVVLTDPAKEELKFWRDNLRSLNGIPFWQKPFVPSKEMFSDASSTGCGAFIKGSSLICHRNWSTEESLKSSTWRELVAIKFALDSFEDHPAGRRICCKTDSQNAVRIVQVGSMIKELQDIALDIFLLCLRQQIQLDVSWVPRDCNSYADFVSKMVDLDDYSVHNDIFLLLEDRQDSTPDSSNPAQKLWMRLHRIGHRKTTGLFHPSHSSVDC